MVLDKYGNGGNGCKTRRLGKCAVGFRATIFTNAVASGGLGAEHWADWFWSKMTGDPEVFNQPLATDESTMTVALAIMRTSGRYPLDSGLRSITYSGTPDFTISPARFGNQ